MLFLIKSLVTATALLCCHVKCPNKMLHGREDHCVLSKVSTRKNTSLIAGSGHTEKQTPLKLVSFTTVTTVLMFWANLKHNLSPDRGTSSLYHLCWAQS